MLITCCVMRNHAEYCAKKSPLHAQMMRKKFAISRKHYSRTITTAICIDSVLKTICTGRLMEYWIERFKINLLRCSFRCFSNIYTSVFRVKLPNNRDKILFILVLKVWSYLRTLIGEKTLQTAGKNALVFIRLSVLSGLGWSYDLYRLQSYQRFFWL